ncbi:MAG: hypothetical protein DWQ19_08885 [Crenarchaeota archaeon]|nr:MAG: hypothetical protein DWQ19_08885 [Thermoproteota archaeon]
MSTKKRGRGRPTVYTGNVAKHIASLVKKFNGVQAREILNAGPKTELAKQRNLKLVPKALNISLPTIYKLAEKAGVKLERGRPAEKAVASKPKKSARKTSQKKSTTKAAA